MADDPSPRPQSGDPRPRALRSPPRARRLRRRLRRATSRAAGRTTIVAKALQVLKNLAHRGACGCEVNTGDGAGILIQMPDAFLRKVAPATLPPAGEYGAGLVFLPREAEHRDAIQRVIAQIVAEEGQRLIGWRDVPTDDSPVGPSAVAVEPIFLQLFIGRGRSAIDAATSRAGREADARARFERKLYVIRKRIEHAVDALAMPDDVPQVVLHRQPVVRTR